jgi:Chorismate mutase type II
VRRTSTTDSDGLLGEPLAEFGAVLDLAHTLGKHLAHAPGSIETEHEPDFDELRLEIDRLDAEILAAVQRRAEVSQIIGKVRMASGGTRLVHRPPGPAAGGGGAVGRGHPREG